MRVPQKITPGTSREAGGIPFMRNASSAGTSSQAALGNSLIQAGNSLGSVGGLLTEQATQARRFGILQGFSAFQASVDERMTELKRNANPALGNFADQATANYANWEDEWLKTVPDEFYDEFKTRATDKKAAVAREALAFQYESTDNFFRQGLTDAVDSAKMALDQDGSPFNLDAQRAAVDEYINSTTLTEAEKVARRRDAYRALESISYKSEVRRGNLEVGALGVGSAPGEAADLILEFSGTDLENGFDYETNRELVQDRVAEAEGTAVETIGDLDRWAALPARARAALISLVDDLGELPPSVKQAIDSGDLQEVAQAVDDLSGTEGDRRAAEAQIILGTGAMPEGMLDADPRFANIPYEDRLALRADAEAEAAAQLAAEQKVAQAAQKEAINNLTVAVYDGEAGQYEIDQAREAGWLSDYSDINRVQTILKEKNEAIAMTQQMQGMLQAGMTINPASEDDRKMFNAYIGPQGQMALREGNMQYVSDVLVPAVRTAGDLPTETVGLLSGMMRAQDPAQALFALDTLSQLEQASPEAYQARVTEAVAADVEYWRTIKDFYPQDEVLAAVRGGTTQEERTRNTMLREEARTLINKGEVDTNLVGPLGDMPGWRYGDPIMSAGQSQALNADFSQIFEREYARDGNIEAARKRSITSLGRIWNTTEIGGQQLLMKYPPELVGYETWNGSHDWITQQGRAELGIEGNFQLISDEQTRSEFQSWQGGGGPRPSYLAVYQDEAGNLKMPLDEQGKPQRIFFEVTPEMEAQKADHLVNARRNLDDQMFMVQYNAAMQHSLSTGMPIPADIVEEFNERRAAKEQQ